MEEVNKEEITPAQKEEAHVVNIEEITPVQKEEDHIVNKEEITPAQKEEAHVDDTPVEPNSESKPIDDPVSVVVKDNKAFKHPRRKKDHSIKFTRTEEKISEEDEIQIEESEVHNTMKDEGKDGCCGVRKGPHITILSIFYIPCALISSLCVSFYYGAWTWYNLYMYFSEERTVWHKVSICPLLILTFPFTVGLTSLGISVFAAFIQLSWFFSSWRTEIVDFDKGFYGWFCDKVGLSQCSPYDFITVNDDAELENLPIRS